VWTVEDGFNAEALSAFYRPRPGDPILLFRIHRADFLDSDGHFKPGVKFNEDYIVHWDTKDNYTTPWGPTEFHLRLDLSPEYVLRGNEGVYWGVMLASGIWWDVTATVYSPSGWATVTVIGMHY